MQPEESTRYWLTRFIARGYPPQAAMVYAEQEARRNRRRVQLEQEMDQMQANIAAKKDTRTPPEIEFRLQ